MITLAAAMASVKSKSKGALLNVLMAFSSFADEHGLCFPSVHAVARRARVSRSTVQTAIDVLVALGEVASMSRGRT